MGKSNPDSALYFLSSNIKNHAKGVFRVTFKKGGLFKKEHAKAHSRIAKQQLKQQLRQLSDSAPENTLSPLLIRVKSNDDKKHLNCETKLGKGLEFASQMMNVFRVAFFNSEAMKVEKPVKTASKPVPGSKSSLKRQKHNTRNRERRSKLKQLQKEKKRQARMAKNNSLTNKQATNSGKPLAVIPEEAN